MNEGSVSNKSARTSERHHPRTQSEIDPASLDRVAQDEEEHGATSSAQVPPSTTVVPKKKEMPKTPGGTAKPVLSFRERRRLREQVGHRLCVFSQVWEVEF